MPIFGTASKEALAKCHPLIQTVLNVAIQRIDFKVLDATRGRLAQEKAVALGHSKVHFGDSAHNYIPAIAVDLFPAPYNWNDRAAFIALSKVILPLPAELKLRDWLGRPVAFRWGGDWNGDGNLSDGWDMPHYELKPWREYAAKYSHLYDA